MKFIGERPASTAKDTSPRRTKRPRTSPQDDERVTRMELRGNSRIVRQAGQRRSAGHAREGHRPDLRRRRPHAADRRTSSRTRSVQLPGEQGKPGKQIAGKAHRHRDGARRRDRDQSHRERERRRSICRPTARRRRGGFARRSSSPPAHRRPADSRAASATRRSAPASTTASTATPGASWPLIDRTARSDKLDIQTKPGFGDLETRRLSPQRALHRRPADTVADAPTAVYDIAQDRLDLSPGSRGRGQGSARHDGRVATTPVTSRWPSRRRR